MSTLAQLLLETSADPLLHARRHAKSGGRVIGVVGAEVPVELVMAAGAMPVALPAFAEESTPNADRHLEPAFTPRLRSITEQWLRGHLDFMESVIFTRADDSAQRCYYYLCELRRRGQARGPVPVIFDIAKIPRATSLNHSRGATQALAEALSSDSGRLHAAIAVRDRRRSLFERLDLLRRSDRPPSGADCERLLRLADTIPAERFDEELAAWLNGDFPRHDGPRVLLVGSAAPDARLHLAVEQAGGCIIGEFDDAGTDQLGPIIGAPADPLAALAHHYHCLGFGPRAFGDRGARLTSRIERSSAGAVISWLIEEDEASAWQVPAMAAVLARARIPVLSMTRRSWDGRDGALEEIAAFTRGLRNRS
jgi:benzoyl-CoA reductase/2-hydroxyglutaryl-CoA dehydratase subunit BcrC/BadD/HgdB